MSEPEGVARRGEAPPRPYFLVAYLHVIKRMGAAQNGPSTLPPILRSRRWLSFQGNQECFRDLPVKGRKNRAARCCDLNQMAIRYLARHVNPTREM